MLTAQIFVPQSRDDRVLSRERSSSRADRNDWLLVIGARTLNPFEHAIDGVHSGDVGHVDDAGRLFVDGREDDIIVSGGENTLPSEVEDAARDAPGRR